MISGGFAAAGVRVRVRFKPVETLLDGEGWEQFVAVKPQNALNMCRGKGCQEQCGTKSYFNNTRGPFIMTIGSDMLATYGSSRPSHGQVPVLRTHMLKRH